MKIGSPRLATKCNTGNKNCGGRCIPVDQNCDVANNADRARFSNELGDVNNTNQAVTNLKVRQKLVGK